MTATATEPRTRISLRDPASPLEWLRRILTALLTVWMVTAGLRAERPLVGVVVAVAVGGATAVAPRWPAAGLIAAYFFVPGMSSLAGYEGPDDVVVLLVAFANFQYGRWAPLERQPWAGVGLVAFVSAVALANGDGLSITDLVFPAAFAVVPWLFGLSIQRLDERNRRAARELSDVQARREQEVEVARRDERLEIARELHDVVAHGVSLVSLQTQVARRRLEAGNDVTADDLLQIETASRAAMDELRALLSVMRPGASGAPSLEPARGLGDLPALVDQYERAGHPCTLTVVGIPRAVPDGFSLTAYRIVQEAVTNALKHGSSGGAVDITLDWGAAQLCIKVRSDLPARPVVGQGAQAPAGHGLVGMAERAAVYGGEVIAGPDNSGRCWMVVATLALDRTWEADDGS